MGMRGTGSSDVRLDRVAVPSALTASLAAPVAPAPEFAGPTYRLFPWPVLAGEAAVSVGVARAALDLVVELVGSRVPAYGAVPLAEREIVQMAVGRSRALIEAARATLRHALTHAHATVSDGGQLSVDQKVSLQLAICTAAENGARAVDLLYDVVGTAAFADHIGLERHFRDAHVLTQHGTKSSMRYASAGKVMLGLPTDASILG
jgi:indole-3-acetate monooxygenase